MNYLTFVVSVYIGYLFNKSLSKNGHKINKRLPYVKIKFLQFSPHVKIHFKNRYLHFHHWMTYSIVLIISLTLSSGFLDTLVSKGYLLGGIIQGLTFPDWNRIIIKKTSL